MKYLENLKYNVKQECIFHLILLGIPSSLILSISNRRLVNFTKWTKSVKHDKSYLSMIPWYRAVKKANKKPIKKLSALVLSCGLIASYSLQTEGVQLQSKMLSTHTLVYQLKMSIPLSSSLSS